MYLLYLGKISRLHLFTASAELCCHPQIQDIWSPIYFIFQTQAISSLHVVVIPFCIYNIFKKTDQPISKEVYPGLTGGQAITLSCTSADIVT